MNLYSWYYGTVNYTIVSVDESLTTRLKHMLHLYYLFSY